ncbi:DUF58 domain-containing protein [Nodosilinea sp. LEGE 07298]|uniref:DUF58 domain-containing protein n=1 Tax=Nodosilinea sp. LEGE 07298 TaxID=2777970 RepID=UPI001880D4AF|nr:DUF58 domain-containing protein [Nodosilinea sp. LEGE 07298]MBE9112254.1 DUF58 domain-containing protein [Nodosilinea sp. LEGE 07298]
MKFAARFTNWLEQRWVNPAYVGWVLLGLALFFFAAATNTLAGWLYVISGVMLALLMVAALLPPRNLQGLVVTRSPIQPVTACIPLAIELRVHNPQRQPKGLFQVIDSLPAALGPVQVTAVRTLPPGQTYTWRYEVPTQRRGIYRWPRVDLRTAAPLGLFWCRRSTEAPATAVVYPQVLTLKRCPLLDTVGPRDGQHWRYNPLAKADTQGITRSLRPYRWGDPTRLIHWRTSARYGELRVRELETITASCEVVIALNTTARWDETSFEQAVVAAASLYTYALKQGFTAALWLPSPAGQDNLLRESNRVMYALAEVAPAPIAQNVMIPPQQSTIWLTAAGTEAVNLPTGSRQIIWGSSSAAAALVSSLSTLRVDPNEPLETQLQVNVT